MLFANFILKDRIKKFNSLAEKAKKDYLSLEVVKGRAYGYIYDMLLGFNETAILLNINNNRLISILNDGLKNIYKAEDLEPLFLVLQNISNEIKSVDYDYDKEYDFSYIENDFKNYNTSIELDVAAINEIFEHITVNRKINIFDCKCREGQLLDSLKHFNSNKYGLEINDYSANLAKKVLDHVIKGDLKGCKITNDSMDIMIAPVSYSYDFKDNSLFGVSVQKLESIFMHTALNYMNPAGVIIFAIPYFRLYKDICTFLSRYLKNIFSFKIKNDKFQTVYIVGKLDLKKTIDFDVFDTLRSYCNYEKVPLINDCDIPNYYIDGELKIVELIKGSKIDNDEILDLFNNSGLMDDFYKDQEVQEESNNFKRPLLPFNIGQIGLVLTSGCLDGVIDEGNGYYHLVKGRVAKKTKVETSVENSVLKQKETSSNNVEIKILLGNGESKTLA